MRLPNPWITIPVLLATAAGGIVGFQVTRVSCAPGSCTGSAVGIGLLSALVALAGVGTVVVLAARSVAEWREAGARPKLPPEEAGPPTS